MFSRPFIADGRVYIGGVDYFLYAFDATPSTRLQWDGLAALTIRGPTRVGGRLVTAVRPDVFIWEHSGIIPLDSATPYVHATDGALVDEQLFERAPDDGRANWAVTVGGGAYVEQKW